MNRLDAFISERNAYVWHAYETLQDGKSDPLQKSRLKVLTSNLCCGLNIDDFGARLDDYTDDLTISFEDYTQFLVGRLYCLVADSQEVAWTAFEHVCWMVLSAKAPELYSHANGLQSSGANRECGFKLFRIFHFLAERDPVQYTLQLPPKLSLEEAQFVNENLDALLGVTASKLTASDGKFCLPGMLNEQFATAEEELLFGALTFHQFAQCLYRRYLGNLNISSLDFSRALDELHAQLLEDVVKRGTVGEYKEASGIKLKPGSSVKDRYAILTRSEFRLYDTTNDSEVTLASLKHSYTLGERIRVEALNDSTSKHVTHFRFVISNDYAKKKLIIVTPDLRSRNEWIEAFALANQYRNSDRSIAAIKAHTRLTHRTQRRTQHRQRADAARREQLVIEQSIADLQSQISSLNVQLSDEATKRQNDANRAKMTEAELRKKMEAEARLKARLAEQEANLRKLESIRLELEALLEIERSAKQEADEQQAALLRTLEEEKARHAALERLNIELHGLLSNEAKQRGALESQRQELEAALRAEADRLRQLEVDQRTIRTKLEQARARLIQAEADKQALTNASAGWASHRGIGAFCDADFSRKRSSPAASEKPINTTPR